MSLDSILSEENPDGKLIPDLDLDVNKTLLVEALKKDKKEADDLTRIYDAVCKLKFFKNLFADTDSHQRSEVLMKLCSNITYESIPMGRFVFRQDDPSNNKFYVILLGEVGILTKSNYSDLYARDKEVYEKNMRLTNVIRGHSWNTLNSINSLSRLDISTKNDLDEIDESNCRQTQMKTLGSSFKYSVVMHRDSRGPSLSTLAKLTKNLTASNLPNEQSKELLNNKSLKTEDELREKDDQDSEDEEGELNNKFDNAEFKSFASRYGFLIRILGEGAEFGDAALKEPGKKRSASILCKTDCEFLVINAQTYNDFIRRKSDLKSEFLLKCFAFLSSVSSSQMKNKITYSFMSRSFPQGHVLMEEGATVNRPKLYLIEFGECKLQKKHVVAVRNPYRPDEVLKEETNWLTICTVGPGNLLGEEVLEYKRPDEHYDYRVTVTSTRLSVLYISKSTFTNIHTELEDQTRAYYQIKKKRRDEIYEQMVLELGSKGKSVSKSEQYLSKHANMAHAINKATLDTFNRRLLRKSTAMTRDCMQHKLLLIQPLASPNIGTPSLLEVVNRPNKTKAFKISTHSGNGRPVTNDNLFEAAASEYDANQKFKELKQERISVIEINPDSNKISRLASPKRDVTEEYFKMPISPSNHRMSLSPINSWFKQPSATLMQDDFFEDASQNNHGKSIKEELITITTNEKAHKRSMTLCEEKTTKPKSRIRVANQVEEKFEKLRDSKQEFHQMNYLSNLPLKAPDTNRVEKLKFIFTQDKESRIRTFNKQKELKKGFIGESKSLNYLSHKHEFGISIKSRLAHLNSYKTTKQQIIVPNINYGKPVSEQTSLALRANLVVSSTSANEDPFHKTGFSFYGGKKSSDQTKGSFKFVTQEEKVGLKCASLNSRVDEVFNTSLDYCLKEAHPGNSVEPTSRIHVSQTNLTDRESNEPNKVNPIYQTLLLKSMMHKQLRRKGMSVSTNRSFSQNSTADNLLESALSFNSNKITLENRSPVA